MKTCFFPSSPPRLQLSLSSGAGHEYDAMMHPPFSSRDYSEIPPFDVPAIQCVPVMMHRGAPINSIDRSVA